MWKVILPIFFFLSGLAFLLHSCDQPESARSELFFEVFGNDTTTFRGLEPRDPITKVQTTEENSPSHSENIGLAYEMKLPSGYTLFLDYWSDYLTSDNPQDLIASISANILFKDEVETARFYNEVLIHFNDQYGVSTGGYGDYSWEGITQKSTAMEIHLKLAENKEGVTINFVDIEPEKIMGEANTPSSRKESE